MSMRKLIVWLLSLQCTVVKGSILSALMLVFGIPVWILLSVAEALEKLSKGAFSKALNTPIRLPFQASSVIEEAGERCSMNIKKLERFYFGKRDE